jgi:hypothetical protein
MKPADNEMLGDVVFIIAWCSFVHNARAKQRRGKRKITYRGIVVLLCLPPSASVCPCLSALSVSDMAG